MEDHRPVFRVRYEWQAPNGRRLIEDWLCRGNSAVEVRAILTQRSDMLRILEITPRP